MSQSMRLDLIGRTTKGDEKNDYYFTRPDIPVSVDLSDCVIFIHPWDKPDGTFGAELIIKKYTPPEASRKHRPRSVA